MQRARARAGGARWDADGPCRTRRGGADAHRLPPGRGKHRVSRAPVGTLGELMPVEDLTDGLKRVQAPLSDADVRALKAGDRVRVFGRVYGARDAAHKRIVEMLDRGEAPP